MHNTPGAVCIEIMLLEHIWYMLAEHYALCFWSLFDLQYYSRLFMLRHHMLLEHNVGPKSHRIDRAKISQNRYRVVSLLNTSTKYIVKCTIINNQIEWSKTAFSSKGVRTRLLKNLKLILKKGKKKKKCCFWRVIGIGSTNHKTTLYCAYVVVAMTSVVHK